ncbi:MAG: RNA methyltransferase [Phycisphaerales bacterium]|nr:RNA methyltransferase [Phycisphaerales bacterium]MCB9862747.1 RNA methyltransferase [Phycisphaerales bacterium]
MAERIDSPQNARIKATARLRERRARKQSGLILIDGGRELLRAIEAGVEVVEAFVCRAVVRGADAAASVVVLENSGAHLIDTSEAAYAKLRFGERDEGIVAVARRPNQTLDSLTIPTNPLIAVIEGVEKPGNLGAIMRTADAAGIDAVIAADARGDIYGPNAIRASLGAIFTVPVVESSSAEALAWLRRAGLQVLTATPDAESSYSDVSYAGGTAIVLGAEASGVSDEWLGDACVRVGLPMCGRVDSLNVSTTAAVLFYEALRQRASLSHERM